MRRRLGRTGCAVAALLVACATIPVAYPGDFVRVSQTQGERMEGELVAMTRDSIEISTTEVAVSIPRDSIERVDLDQRARSSWLRFYECATAALYGGSAVSRIRSEDGIRGAIFVAMAGVGGWMCLRPHAWVRARLPDVAPASPPDSATPGL